MPNDDTVRRALADRYLRFADEEARDRSPLYEALARAVARDQDLLDFLLTLPAAKRQPNLLFAALRWRAGTPADAGDFKRRLQADAEAVRAVMLVRSTQTNEPGRCATLLPVLARLPQPLALVEVGASAGLCLLPDFYGYDYGPYTLRPEDGEPGYPVFSCTACPNTPLPVRMPEIVWRAGLDLNPLDPADPEHALWLETLVWPEQTRRRDGLRAALRVAAARKLDVVAGSLTGSALDSLCREAPAGATLVVFHTAVLAYVADPSARRAFADRVRAASPYWISNEAPRVLAPHPGSADAPGRPGRFLLSVNGEPVAWTDPHGAAIEWITEAADRATAARAPR